MTSLWATVVAQSASVVAIVAQSASVVAIVAQSATVVTIVTQSSQSDAQAPIRARRGSPCKQKEL